jgi:Arc/MetJ-type ribon-helix-helix transcriptional regulator
MGFLLHIRVGKEIKSKMKTLVGQGLFSNEAEIIREGIRSLLLKYQEKK